jgi:hypothetical protein
MAMKKETLNFIMIIEFKKLDDFNLIDKIIIDKKNIIRMEIGISRFSIPNNSFLQSMETIKRILDKELEKNKGVKNGTK